VENFAAPSIQQLAAGAVWFSFRHGFLWYQIPAGLASLLLLLVSLLRPGPACDGGDARLRRGDLAYLLALAVFLFALRWPALAVGDLEGDESVAVSAALTRYLAPAYGVTLFTGSAGPLLTYPVSALGLLGLRIDSASKLVSLLLITASSAILFLALRTFSEARTARVAMLPLLAFLGLGNTHWTISYCSEQWINLLVIAMIFFLLRLGRQIGRESTNLIGIGLALGLIPLVKWQGMPMAALVVVCAIAIVWRRCLHERAAFGALAVRLVPLAAFGLAPLLVWCVILASFGGLGFFFDTYFTALFTQATTRYSSTFLERLIALPRWGITRFPMERVFLSLTALFCVPAAITLWLVQRPRRCPLDLALAALYLLISVYAVLQPGGPFSHYMNLLLQPYAALIMLIFCRLTKAAARPARVCVAYLGLTVLLPTMAYLRDAPLPVRFRPSVARGQSFAALRALQASGSPMIQWGWAYAYYVQTGMTWGSRTGGSHEILEPFFPDKAIFVADYVESLESGRAPVFLETTMEGAGMYANHALYGHEQVPEIADAVRRNYFPCAGIPGARLYLHRKWYGNRPNIQAWCIDLRRRAPPAPS
jgi:hypothetical protein